MYEKFKSGKLYEKFKRLDLTPNNCSLWWT